MLRKTLLLAVLLLSCTVRAEPASEASIRELLSATGTSGVGEQFLSQMIASMKQSMPGAPEAFWTEFEAEADVDAFIELIVPIYQRYLTAEDVAAINEFNRSDAGKKLIRIQPQLLQESMVAGQAWSRAAAQRAMAKVQAAETP